jgi:hypothetical protein
MAAWEALSLSQDTTALLCLCAVHGEDGVCGYVDSTSDVVFGVWLGVVCTGHG